MDEEHTILNHYNLATPNPIAWPAEKDSDDTDDDDISSKKGGKTNLRRSKTRYSALERSGSDRRSLVPGSEKTGDGVENLVQRDETDPLGGADSVVRILRQKGIAVDDDQRLSEVVLAWRIAQELIYRRESLSFVIYDFLTQLILIPNPLEYFHTIITAGARVSFAFNRSEICFTKGTR